MAENNICAVVVTFRPSSSVLDSLAMVRPQVRDLVVVDNGSPAETLVWLGQASHEMDFALVQNGDNLGIAAALNIGVRWAESQGHEYVILFDQDSVVTPGFVNTMLRGYHDNPRQDRVAILVPSYVDKRLGTVLPAHYASDGDIEIAMCSGSLMPIAAFHDQGWFEESLFIDYVDYEYCLRVRSAGYLIKECKQAVLLHAPGNPKVYRLFGFRFLTSANYSAFRRYYIERNMVWVVRKYWKKYPSLCLNMFLNSIKDGVKVILVENNKWGKVRYSILGFVDGLLGRMEKKYF